MNLGLRRLAKTYTTILLDRATKICHSTAVQCGPVCTLFKQYHLSWPCTAVFRILLVACGAGPAGCTGNHRDLPSGMAFS
jgi:hypothetical protein